jgi:hypothetical protein
MTTLDAPAARPWLRLARRTARKVNLAWWWQHLAPLLGVTGLVGFAVIVWLRSRGGEIGLAQVAPWLAGALALAGGSAWLRGRKHFISAEQGLVRLEAQLRLRNALSAAAAGVAPWPDAPPQVRDGWTWRWPWLGGPVAGAAVCFAAALLLPIRPDAAALAPTVQPQAWQQMDDWLKQLEEEQVLAPESQEELAEKLDALRDQPPDKWFSHESLHASDTLRQQMQHNLQQMGAGMETAERSLNFLDKYDAQLNSAAKEQLLEDFQNALQGLKANQLQLDPALLQQLQKLDPSQLKNLDAKQLAELKQALQKKSGTCKSCQSGGSQPGFLGDGKGEDDELAQLMALMKQKQGAGKGGVQRGPGTAPLTLADTESNLGTNKLETVANPDYSRASVADQLGLSDGKHEVDQTATGPQAAGAIQAIGQGGEQVWRESLTPSEKAVLKRVFK